MSDKPQQNDPHSYPNHPSIQKVDLHRGTKVLDMSSGQWIVLPAPVPVQAVPMLVFGYNTAQGPRCYAVPASVGYPGERQPIFQAEIFPNYVTPIVRPAPGDAPTDQPSVDPPEHPENIYDPARLFGSR